MLLGENSLISHPRRLRRSKNAEQTAFFLFFGFVQLGNREGQGWLRDTRPLKSITYAGFRRESNDHIPSTRDDAMSERRHKTRRQKDVTSSFLSGDLDEDQIESQQRFSRRSKGAQQDKMEKTALLRAADGSDAADIQTLPVGQVVQVYSQFCRVEHPDGDRLCVTRKTLGKLSDSAVVVGDLVRFRDSDQRDESGLLQA